MKKFCVILIVVILSSIFYQQAKAQVIYDDGNPDFAMREADWTILASNMIFNGLVDGFQAAHTKNIPLGKTLQSRTFWHAAKQGAIGGAVAFTGKKVIGFGREDNTFPILAGKFIHDFGTSISYSAAIGEDYGVNPRFMTDLGPVILSWTHKAGFQYYFSPSNINTLAYLLREDTKFDLKNSVRTLTPVFQASGESIVRIAGHAYMGYATYNSIVLRSESRGNSVIAHEAIHTRQHFGFICLEPYFRQKARDMADSSVSRIVPENYSTKIIDKLIAKSFSSKLTIGMDIASWAAGNANQAFAYEERWNEYEAYQLERSSSQKNLNNIKPFGL